MFSSPSEIESGQCERTSKVTIIVICRYGRALMASVKTALRCHVGFHPSIHLAQMLRMVPHFKYVLLKRASPSHGSSKGLVPCKNQTQTHMLHDTSKDKGMLVSCGRRRAVQTTDPSIDGQKFFV